MRALVVFGLVFGWVAAAGAGAGKIYVPGQYKDGVYTHPHFVADPEPGDVKSILPLEDPAQGEPTPEVLNPDALPDRAPLSSS